MNTIFHPESPVVKWFERVADVMMLNILYLIFCLPVFTIGAATTALYRVCLNFADKNEASPITELNQLNWTIDKIPPDVG